YRTAHSLRLPLWTDGPAGEPIKLYAAFNERDEAEFVERRVELDRLAGRAVGPERLAEPRRVVRDDGVRGVQDRGRRAIVLLQAYDLRAGVILLEPVEVLDARAAPTVDRLIVVADDERHARRARD